MGQVVYVKNYAVNKYPGSVADVVPVVRLAELRFLLRLLACLDGKDSSVRRRPSEDEPLPKIIGHVCPVSWPPVSSSGGWTQVVSVCSTPSGVVYWIASPSVPGN